MNTIRIDGYDFDVSEFSMSLRWLPKHRTEGPEGPGFYLTAGFANEGVAGWLAKDVLVSPASMRDLIEHIGAELELDRMDEHAAAFIEHHYLDNVKKQLAAAEARLRRAEEEVPRLRQQLEAARARANES